MKIVKRIMKWLGYLLLIPVSYILVSLLLTLITIDRKASNEILENTIYLSTNGIHLEVVIPKQHIDGTLLNGLKHSSYDNYLSFGWGEEEFYLNTPTWGDLTLKGVFRAAFLKSTTLMHVTRYTNAQSDWVAIKISATELRQLNTFLNSSFQTTANGEKFILQNKGYTSRDDFYKANGSYSCFNTCNSWVNTAFKQSGLKACLWTPFDFGLMNKYK